MEHAFKSLLLVDHDCFRSLTQHLYSRLQPVGVSKVSCSLIPIEKQLVERSVVKRLEKVKAVVISYDLCMSCKVEKSFSLTTHYFTGPERKNTHIRMTSSTATDYVSLFLSIMEVMENFGLGIFFCGDYE